MGSLTLTSFPHHKVVFPGRSLHANETSCLALQNTYKAPSAGAGGRWSEGPILAFPPCPRPAPTTTGYFQPVWVSRCFLASLSAYFCFPIHAIHSITHRHSHLSALPLTLTPRSGYFASPLPSSCHVFILEFCPRRGTEPPAAKPRRPWPHVKEMGRALATELMRETVLDPSLP